MIRSWMLVILLVTVVVRVHAGDRPGDGDLPPGIHPRPAWNAAPARAGMIPQRPRRITVHHTETRSGPGEPEVGTHLRSIQRYHQTEKKWPDIAYHILIDPRGRLWEGRSLGNRGDSGTSYDLSDRALVCLIGKFDEDPVSSQQWTSLVRTVGHLCRRYDIGTDQITMHRQLAQTSCPGAHIAERVTDGTLRRDVEAWLRDRGQGKR